MVLNKFFMIIYRIIDFVECVDVLFFYGIEVYIFRTFFPKADEKSFFLHIEFWMFRIFLIIVAYSNWNMRIFFHNVINSLHKNYCYLHCTVICLEINWDCYRICYRIGETITKMPPLPQNIILFCPINQKMYF